MSEHHDGTSHRVLSHLGDLLESRGLTLVQLAAHADVTVANLSVLKNGRARAVRFSTLTAICDALDCQPGDILTVPRAPLAPGRAGVGPIKVPLRKGT